MRDQTPLPNIHQSSEPTVHTKSDREVHGWAAVPNRNSSLLYFFRSSQIVAYRNLHLTPTSSRLNPQKIRKAAVLVIWHLLQILSSTSTAVVSFFASPLIYLEFNGSIAAPICRLRHLTSPGNRLLILCHHSRTTSFPQLHIYTFSKQSSCIFAYTCIDF